MSNLQSNSKHMTKPCSAKLLSISPINNLSFTSICIPTIFHLFKLHYSFYINIFVVIKQQNFFYLNISVLSKLQYFLVFLHCVKSRAVVSGCWSRAKLRRQTNSFLKVMTPVTSNLDKTKHQMDANCCLFGLFVSKAVKNTVSCQ